MDSDVEEGEIRESECLSPLSADDALERFSDSISNNGQCGGYLSNKRKYKELRSNFPKRPRQFSKDSWGKSIQDASVSVNRKHRFGSRRTAKFEESSSNSVKFLHQKPEFTPTISRTITNNKRIKKRSPRTVSSPSLKINTATSSSQSKSTAMRKERSQSTTVNTIDKITNITERSTPDAPKSPDYIPELPIISIPLVPLINEKDDGSDVQLISVVDKSTRQAELIVIDSTSSSETDDDQCEESGFNAEWPMCASSTSPTVDALSIVTIDENFDQTPSHEKTEDIEIFERDSLSLIEEEDELEELELRRKALEGLVQKFPAGPSDNTDESTTATSPSLNTLHIADNIVMEPEIRTGRFLIPESPRSPSPTLPSELSTTNQPYIFLETQPNDSEKENELELYLLRQKLLSDLAKSKKDISTKHNSMKSSSNTVSSLPSKSQRRDQRESYSTGMEHIQPTSYSYCPRAIIPRRSLNQSIVNQQDNESHKTISVSVSTNGKSRTVTSSPGKSSVKNLTPPSMPRFLGDTRVAFLPSFLVPSNMDLASVQSETHSPLDQAIFLQNPILNVPSAQLNPIPPLTKETHSVRGRIEPKVASPTKQTSKVKIIRPHGADSFNIVRTVYDPRAGKAANPKLLQNQNHSGKERINHSVSKKSIRRIVIPIRDDDQSTDDENLAVGNPSAALPKEFHSSLDKFLKTVRESASLNQETINQKRTFDSPSTFSKISAATTQPKIIPLSPIKRPIITKNTKKSSLLGRETISYVQHTLNHASNSVLRPSETGRGAIIPHNIVRLKQAELLLSAEVAPSLPQNLNCSNSKISTVRSPSQKTISSKKNSSSPTLKTANKTPSSLDVDKDLTMEQLKNSSANSSVSNTLPIKQVIPSSFNSLVVPLLPVGQKRETAAMSFDYDLSSTTDQSIKAAHNVPKFLKCSRTRANADQPSIEHKNNIAKSDLMLPFSPKICLEKMDLMLPFSSKICLEKMLPSASPKKNNKGSKRPESKPSSSEQVKMSIVSKDIGSSTKGSMQNLTKQATQARQELHMREKLLRATLIRKEEQLKLSSKEKDFLTVRQTATILLGSAIEKLNNHSEKLKQCTQLEKHVEKLKSQLQLAELSLQHKVEEARAIHEDAVSAIHKAFDMREKSANFAGQCKTMGEMLNGERYKIPTVGASEMLIKVKEIYKLTIDGGELKKGPVNFKKLERQIVDAFSSTKLDRQSATTDRTLNEVDEESMEADEDNCLAVSGILRARAIQRSNTPSVVKEPFDSQSYISCGVMLKKENNLEIFSSYQSPLLNQNGIVNSCFENVKAIWCKNDIFGNCQNRVCKYQHLIRKTKI